MQIKDGKVLSVQRIEEKMILHNEHNSLLPHSFALISILLSHPKVMLTMAVLKIGLKRTLAINNCWLSLSLRKNFLRLFATDKTLRNEEQSARKIRVFAPLAPLAMIFYERLVLIINRPQQKNGQVRRWGCKLKSWPGRQYGRVFWWKKALATFEA